MENNINNQIKELNQLGGKLLMLEMIILKNFIDKAKNNIIRQYLEEMLHNHIYISFVSDFLKDFEKSAYALRVFNDTHALDNGTKLRNELNKYLQKTYNSTDLENIGIISNHASSTVWSYKVTTNYGYTGTSLLDVKTIPLLNNKVIWIFENINTAQRIIQNELDFPFIITAGRPTKAFHELIKRLIKIDITLYYHGDMDKAGVNMLKSLKEKYPNLKAPFMTTSEFEKHTKTKAPKHQHYLTDGLSVLEMMIHNSDKVVYEEQLDLKKCLNYIK